MWNIFAEELTLHQLAFDVSHTLNIKSHNLTENISAQLTHAQQSQSISYAFILILSPAPILLGFTVIWRGNNGREVSIDQSGMRRSQRLRVCMQDVMTHVRCSKVEPVEMEVETETVNVISIKHISLISLTISSPTGSCHLFQKTPILDICHFHSTKH